MIVFTPVNLPKVEPDDWPTFWDIWNANHGLLTKVVKTDNSSIEKYGNASVWIGLDIYSKFNLLCVFKAPFFDIKYKLPKLYDTISNISDNVYRVRLVQSIKSIASHTDDDIDVWSMRAFFHGNNAHKQWYFTKPNDSQGQRTYINMPEDTNWFMYNDKKCWHGTDYDPNNKKILLQIYSIGSTRKDYFSSSIEKYKNYIIEY